MITGPVKPFEEGFGDDKKLFREIYNTFQSDKPKAQAMCQDLNSTQLDEYIKYKQCADFYKKADKQEAEGLKAMAEARREIDEAQANIDLLKEEKRAIINQFAREQTAKQRGEAPASGDEPSHTPKRKAGPGRNGHGGCVLM